ncbi:MAG: DapH/DapD/GlmU-related protein, partial [Nanoarchaeota archaeon]
DYITYLIEKGEKVHYEKITNYWFPVTYPWSLLEANEFLLSKIKRTISGEVEKYAVIKGPVIIGKGTVIKSGSYIEGPAAIGDNCKIGPNCYIRAHSSIGNDCKIGNAVEVKNTIIGDRTSIGHLSYVGDSVIGDDVNFGAGTIIANLRHDGTNVNSPVKGDMIDTGRKKFGAVIGDNVKLGIKTSIYPGRKFWPGSKTAPGEIVKKDMGGW